MQGDDWLPHQNAVAVVIVHRDPGSGRVTAAAGGPALDLGNAAPAAPEVIERIRESLVRIDAAEDVPSAVVDALRAAARSGAVPAVGLAAGRPGPGT